MTARAPAREHRCAAPCPGIRARMPALVLLLLLVAPGCLSYAAGKLQPLRTDAAPAIAVERPVGYTVAFRFNGEPNPAMAGRLEQRWRAMAAESGALRDLQGRADAPPGGAHVALVLEDRGNVPLAFVSGLLCGLTLTILPACAVDHFTLDAELTRPGAPAVRLHYEEDVTTWIELFLVFGLGGPTPADTIDATVDELLRHAVHDVARELGSAPGTSGTTPVP